MKNRKLGTIQAEIGNIPIDRCNFFRQKIFRRTATDKQIPEKIISAELNDNHPSS